MDFGFCNKEKYNKNEKDLIKCFLASMLIDGYIESTVADYFYVINNSIHQLKV